MKKLLTAIAVGLSVLTSCIKEEALNAECDIVEVSPEWVDAMLSRNVLVGQPVVKNDRVDFTVKKGSDRTALAPEFVLTPGATIVPASGTARDFTTPQTYVTTSQDGQWKKQYTVSFKYPTALKDLSFEHFALDSRGKYYEFFEVGATPDDRFDYWDSGNAGYNLTGMAKQPENYPTVHWASGYRGNAVKLTTLSTGTWGRGVRMPIAAGNLFIGEFRVSQAMIAPLKATRFGRQLVSDRPLRLEGYYKYTAGEKYQDIKEVVHPEKRDTCDIYAVVFEVDPENFTPLNGADVLSSDRIVLLSRIDNPGEPEDWRFFSEPFRPVAGKTFDYGRLTNDGYAITVVCTSSRQGAYFEGAIGSTLFVDELKIVWENDN